MKKDYNTKLSQLAGLATAFASEIENDISLKSGEKFLLLQRFFADIAKLTKAFEKMKKEIEVIAKETLYDKGDGKSEEMEIEGASVMIKFAYSKPKLNAELLKKELIRAYADLNIEFEENKYLVDTTPRKTVIIQSKIKLSN